MIEIAELRRKNKELMEQSKRQEHASTSYKQQRAVAEESLYKKIREVTEDKRHWKEQTTHYKNQLESLEKLHQSQEELLKSMRDVQLDPDSNSLEMMSTIESLKEEILEWKDKCGSYKEMEEDKIKLESAYKRLEMRLQVANESNKSLSRRLTELQNGAVGPGRSENVASREYMNSLAANHSKAIAEWKDHYDKLLREYRSLEDAYRDLNVHYQSEKRKLQQQIAKLPFMQERPPLLDDGYSIDSRMDHHIPYESSSMEELHGRMSRGSGSGSASIADSGHHQPIPMVNNMPLPLPNIPSNATSRSNTSSSPIDLFNSILPRRATSNTSSTKATAKIKPNSEIRIYGRYVPLLKLY
jgi:myosin heavy subunit